jgi:hypothetical protein
MKHKKESGAGDDASHMSEHESGDTDDEHIGDKSTARKWVHAHTHIRFQFRPTHQHQPPLLSSKPTRSECCRRCDHFTHESHVNVFFG